MLRNVGIAGKLALMLLLPMLGLAYFAGSKVLDKAETASAAGRLQRDTELAVRVSAFVHEFQTRSGTVLTIDEVYGHDKRLAVWSTPDRLFALFGATAALSRTFVTEVANALE